MPRNARAATKAKVAILISLASSFALSGFGAVVLLVSPLVLIISVIVSASDSDAAVEARVEDLSLVDMICGNFRMKMSIEAPGSYKVLKMV